MQRLSREEDLAAHTRHKRQSRFVIPNDGPCEGINVECYSLDLEQPVISGLLRTCPFDTDLPSRPHRDNGDDGVA